MMYLGFDTSNYTTSVAAYEKDNVRNERLIIPVKQGERGIRQSDGVFHHLKTLPKLYNNLDLSDVRAIGVSTRPRNLEDSYMPVFLAGEGYGEVVAKTLNIPIHKFSHQDGHIGAGIMSGNATELLEDEFLALHLSGGTCEILKCRYNGYNFDTEILGGTKDISAGQLIDRSGVYMGMKFPSGREMEKCAKEYEKEIKLPVSVKGEWINFSGLENKVKDLLGKEKNADISRAVLSAVSVSLEKALNYVIDITGVNRILAVGGVMSNSYLRQEFINNINAKIYFATPEYSTDNAAGIAYLTYIYHEGI